MNGQDNIVGLRLSGIAPQYVWVIDRDSEPLDDMTVHLLPTDVPELQDWRFTHGLTVLVEGPNANRVERISKACVRFALRIITSVYQEGDDGLAPRKFETTSIRDSEGHCTWQP